MDYHLDIAGIGGSFRAGREGRLAAVSQCR